MKATTPEVAAYFSASNKIEVIKHNLWFKLMHDVCKTVETARECTPPVTEGWFRYGNENILFSAEELEAIWSFHNGGHKQCNCYHSCC